MASWAASSASSALPSTARATRRATPAYRSTRMPNAARSPATGLQHDFAAGREVAQELLRQRGGEMVAFGEEIQLVVPEQARDVEITRPDARPAVIDQQRLGMQHRALPLEDAGTRTQQIAIADPRGVTQDGEVARAGDEA